MHRLALITGASSGLGFELAKLLKAKGIPLFLTGRDEKRLAWAASQLSAPYMTLDLSKDRKPLLDWIAESSPDLVINNAGRALYGPALMHSSREQMALLEINAAAPLEITLAAARALRAQKQSGIILNVASAAAELSFPSFAVYAAAKACVSSFSRSLDAEMRHFGIRVLVSLPGQIATPFASNASLGNYSQKTSLSVMSPEYAARRIYRQIEKCKPFDIFDYRTKLSLLLARLLPTSLVEKVLQNNLSKRYNGSPF